VISITQRDGKEVYDVRYYISSLPLGVKRFAQAMRGHWGIENSMHWTLDMTFREDESRIRKDYSPDNFALLRRFTSPGSSRTLRQEAKGLHGTSNRSQVSPK